MGSLGGETRSLKMETVHDLARTGDLQGLQHALGQDNSLLNSRNPVLCQTPIHVAAGYNRSEIVKFLLEWKGSEMIQLETINMYGETPLHMATKNSSFESAKLLVEHGASLDAKANNGMSPLHLAVWDAIIAGDCRTVEMLLEHNADCTAKDNEGKEPLDHVPSVPAHETLRKLLEAHKEAQRIWKAAQVSSREAKALAEFDESISHIIGLRKMKAQMRRWARGMLVDEKRRSLGLDIEERKVPHMAFLGNPGTGKTMVAHILGKLLHRVGILPTEKVTVVQRSDLVGEFVGHTGPKTRRKVKEAEGGILLVDEAYRLIPMQKSDDKDYGIEALEEIMSFMDQGKIVVIFAGYLEPMKRVIEANEGFRRRVEKYFFFDDFSPLELAQILCLKMRSLEFGFLKGFKLHEDCTVERIAEMIERKTSEKFRKDVNGGLVRPVLWSARESLDERVDFEWESKEDLVTITLEDLERGVEEVSSENPDLIWGV
ncbi:hypothetical protein LUZ60_012571 [Juncus effusus]|nr:hypothetical protein LUZ60_012571 [Juncus effusus]